MQGVTVSWGHHCSLGRVNILEMDGTDGCVTM